MQIHFTHLVIQNRFENTKYYVRTEKLIRYKGKYFMILENCKNGELKYLETCPFMGTKRILVKENILCHIKSSDKFIFARVIDNVILIEDKDF